MMKGQAETNLDDDILSGDRPSYDKAAKKFLSKRRLLARILHHLIPEFRQVSRQDIEEKYIVGDPLVGTVPVEPGLTNHTFPSEIRGAAQEQSDDKEGTITFDVLFYATLPKSGELVKFIINLEAQKAMPTDYPLMKRVMFYGCRLISSQKEREFEKSDYGSICKVYTIWLCFEPPEGYGSGINFYGTTEKRILGDYREKPENYQLMNAIVVYIGDHRTGDNLLNLLRLIFKQGLSGIEKRKLLEQEYDMKLTDEMGEELDTMCNLSEGIVEKEQKKTILRLQKAGEKLSTMAAATGWTLERIKTFLKSQNLQPVQ